MPIFYIIKDLDTGDYMPPAMGRAGRGGTHQELLPAGCGLPPRLYHTQAGAFASLRWWLQGRTSVSRTGFSSFEDYDVDESWHTEDVPERRQRNMDVVPVEIDV